MKGGAKGAKGKGGGKGRNPRGGKGARGGKGGKDSGGRKGPTAPSTLRAPLHILCLHGNKQCGELFSQRISGLVKRARQHNLASFHFPDAPHELPLEPGQSVAMRTWWRHSAGDDSDTTPGRGGWDVSLAQLEAEFQAAAARGEPFEFASTHRYTHHILNTAYSIEKWPELRHFPGTGAPLISCP